MSLGIGQGDEVITTPFSFIATAESIALLGATPVFVDIEKHTFNLDPGLIERAITSKTKAVIAVGLFGQCADMDEVNAIANRHQLYVIEDAAQSFGATYKGRKSGSLSSISCTSFFPSKPLGCYGDGGACFTDDDELAESMRQIRIHGQAEPYRHNRLGLTGRLDTIQAAILLAKMEIFSEEVKKREDIGRLYTKYLEESAAEAISPPMIEGHNRSVYAQYTVRVDERQKIVESLKQSAIPTAIYYPIPLHRQEVFRNLSSADTLAFPQAESAAASVLSLPMHPYLTEPEIEEVVDALVLAATRHC